MGEGGPVITERTLFNETFLTDRPFYYSVTHELTF